MIRRIMIVLGIIYVLFAAVELDAHADPMGFIQTLNDRGVYVYDARLAVTNGYLICDALRTVSPAQVALNVYNNTSYSDVPNLDTAIVWVVTARQQLCSPVVAR